MLHWLSGRLSHDSTHVRKLLEVLSYRPFLTLANPFNDFFCNEF